MLLKLDPSLSTPIRFQVLEGIKRLIDTGAIQPGTPLPSSRKLAETLGVSRSTIYFAYEELQAMGYLQSRPGSYNVVQHRQREVPYDPARKSIIAWERASTPSANALFGMSNRFTRDLIPSDVPPVPGLINLVKLDADHRHLPLEEFKRSMNHVLQNAGAGTLTYSSSQGYLPLREYIAQRSRLHGISVSADEVLVTNGGQQAIDLVFRLLVRQRSTVITETPTYGVILPLLRLADAKVAGIPLNGDGMDLRILERTLRKGNASLLYTMPNFQNPTGITTTHTHREALLRLCAAYRVPLLEDGFDEDLKYYGKVDLPIKSMDSANLVVYIGSFSKALFPGLRMGWIIADKECIARLLAIKRFADLGTSNLLQAVMHHFCSEGYYDHHLKRLYRRFQHRMEHTLSLMKQLMPEGCSWNEPAGGYTIWVKMPKKLDEAGFEKLFKSRGVAVTPGWCFFPGARSSEYFRISISAADEDEITEGIGRIAQAIKAL